SFKVFYHPGFDKLLRGAGSESKDEMEKPAGAILIEQSDCESCHNERLKTVGPSYLSVARRYGDSDEIVTLLAGKVIKGGSGVWGQAMMTPHADLPVDDVKEMIQYILSLDDGEGGSGEKGSLGEKSTPIKLGEKYEGSGGKGLLAHFYNNVGEMDLLEVSKELKPTRQGAVEKLHALSTADFLDAQQDFAIEFKGSVNITADGSYSFRLISDDGSYLFIDDKLVIDNSGRHGPEIKDGEVYLKKGKHKVRILYRQGNGGAYLSFQWFDKKKESFVLLDDELSFDTSDILETEKFIPIELLSSNIPGDTRWLADVHPSFDMTQARPDDFQPRVGGIDFLSDGRMVVCTWDADGPVYLLENWQSSDPEHIKVKRVAFGLAEPLGVKVVDDEIYVLQKQELTKLVDLDGDDLVDEYLTVSNDWKVSSNFHEFAFGLAYKDGYFYATLATAIMPGGASADPQISDRGKVMKINKDNGRVEFLAHGLRTPNGIGFGLNDQLFVADNQGDWLPSSKIVHIQKGKFYGARSVDPEGTKDLEETQPVVWLPQDEIGNSPSTPLGIEVGPYQGQLIHGEVTHGGVKRVFIEKVEEQYQGAVFRFTQGLEAGINRIAWAPDGSLIAGGIGVSGNWGQTGKLGYGLQRLNYNGKTTFEMLKVIARSNGFEIEFTEPIAEGQYLSAADFQVLQWYYKPTKAYGGPKLGQRELAIRSFNLSDDRKKVFLELSGLKEKHVVYFRIVRPFVSKTDQELWTTEAWYTLNSIPSGQPGFVSVHSEPFNQLTDLEKSQGWKLLFDGKTTNGIRNFKKETLVSRWIADQGTLHFMGKGAEEGWQSKAGGDIIITDQEYKDYELYLEWKISEGGNSGIIYNVIENDSLSHVWKSGPEMQILDNVRHRDGRIEKHRAGDLYDMIATKFVTVMEPMQWNRVRLKVKDGHVEHWQNGYKVVEFDMWTPEWKEMIAGSKFKKMKYFGTGRVGHVALQDHGDKVWFRNIKIRAL
ncbi:MAG: DUF1080 domain-containing protein, partial [Cyclobacteriaceae bacterium]|nr:DUF1080 domain-containing protein [Cyclobacteriaceae bacterium HetDA_MAG_MS6]